MTNSLLYKNQNCGIETMNDVTKTIFESGLQTKINICDQYMQTAFVEIMTGIVNPKNVSYDDVAKEAALNNLKKIKKMLSTAVSLNAETKAHRANLQFIITNALEAK